MENKTDINNESLMSNDNVCLILIPEKDEYLFNNEIINAKLSSYCMMNDKHNGYAMYKFNDYEYNKIKPILCKFKYKYVAL